MTNQKNPDEQRNVGENTTKLSSTEARQAQPNYVIRILLISSALILLAGLVTYYMGDTTETEKFDQPLQTEETTPDTTPSSAQPAE